MIERPERVRSVRVPALGSFWALRELAPQALEDVLRAHRENAEHGRCLKNNRGTVVTRVPATALSVSLLAPQVSDVVVKEARLPWRRRLAHRAGAVSRFCRDFEIFDRLRALGVAAPLVIAASHRPAGGTEHELTAYVADARTLRECLWLGERVVRGDRERADLLARTGVWLRQLHDAGLWHRDLKPNNILVRMGPGGECEFLLLDTTAVRFRNAPLATRERRRNLAQILDLPASFDDEAPGVLLAAYTASREAGVIGGLERRVRDAIDARRERRRRHTGFLYVDEEHAKYGERP